MLILSAIVEIVFKLGTKVFLSLGLKFLSRFFLIESKYNSNSFKSLLVSSNFWKFEFRNLFANFISSSSLQEQFSSSRLTCSEVIKQIFVKYL